MGYQIFTGHRLESLVEGRQDLFLSPLLGPRPMVVLQNQSLAQWLKLFLARSAGGYVTGDFLFQDGAVRRLLEGSGATQDRLLFLDDLKYALYRYLTRALAGPPDPVFLPLAPSGLPDPLRLFELADHIAGVFHNYAMNSRIWPEALGSGVFPPDLGTDPGSFAWQSRLWEDLLTGDQGTLVGLVMERYTRRPPTPGPGPVPRIILVGSAFLSLRTSAFLQAWAAAGLVDVVHLLLLPAPVQPGMSWSLERPWGSWGAFGRAFLGMVPPGPGGFPGTPGTTALGLLQDSLARGVPFPGSVSDGTLTIVSCPHPLRELEVLRDDLLGALAADPGLQVNEIAVLAPDIKVYAPFLDAAFGSDDPGRNLRFHVIDLDLGRENAWFRALDALLSLVSGTLDRPTLFTLVDTPAFREAWEVDSEERDLWLDYTEEVSAWREEAGDGPGPQTWGAGADRLFSGWFRTSAPETGIPPLDTAPSAFVSLGRFQKLVAGLKTQGQRTRQPRPFSGWVRFLDQVFGEYLAPGDGTGAVLSGRLRTLDADGGTPEDPMPWAGFRAFVQDQIAHFPGRRGQLLTEGVHCSSLRPLRSIPFKVIAVLGLDEGSFPRQAPGPNFDLMRLEPGQDQISALSLDRYCFWETLMAARVSLHLSFKGRSPVDGSPLPPSPVLADLMDHLETSGTPWPVVQASVKDFAALEAPPPTWSPRTWRRARAAGGLTPLSPVSLDPGLAPGELPDFTELFPEVGSGDVVLAFTKPAQFHLRKVRQVVLRDEDRRGVDDEEPWSLSFLDRQSWIQDGVRNRLEGRDFPWDVEGFLGMMTATGKVRAGVFTDRDHRDLDRLAAQASRWADQLLAEHWTVEGPRTPERTRWADRPWAPEPGERLVRGEEVRYFRLLYGADVPVRTLFDPALRFLLDPSSRATLDTLNPRGIRKIMTWTLDKSQTRDLAPLAEEYWKTAVEGPRPYYPDFLEALAKVKTKAPSDPWENLVEEAWRTARDNTFTRSQGTLAQCPYAALAFTEDPPFDLLAGELDRWWNPLFVPLMEAWQ